MSRIGYGFQESIGISRIAMDLDFENKVYISRRGSAFQQQDLDFKELDLDVKNWIWISRIDRDFENCNGSRF